MTTTAELLVQLRAWLALHAPGLVPSHLVVHFYNSSIPLQLPIAVASMAQDAPEEIETADGPQRVSKCIADILEALETAGKPMTTTRLIVALDKARKYWSKRTLDRHLAEMVRDGTLLKGEAKNPGYRLPEWDTEGTS